MNVDIQMNPNELVQFLNKPSSSFMRDDILKFMEACGVEMLSFFERMTFSLPG